MRCVLRSNRLQAGASRSAGSRPCAVSERGQEATRWSKNRRGECRAAGLAQALSAASSPFRRCPVRIFFPELAVEDIDFRSADRADLLVEIAVDVVR